MHRRRLFRQSLGFLQGLDLYGDSGGREQPGGCTRGGRGLGIPEELIGKVFERFTRGETSRNRTSGGFGIGLAVCSDSGHPGQQNLGSKPEARCGIQDRAAARQPGIIGWSISNPRDLTPASDCTLNIELLPVYMYAAPRYSISK